MATDSKDLPLALLCSAPVRESAPDRMPAAAANLARALAALPIAAPPAT